MRFTSLQLDGEGALGELAGHADLAAGLGAGLLGGQGLATALGQLGADNLGLPLLVGVELLQVGLLGLVQDGQDASDVLAHDIDLAQLGGGTGDLLSDAQLGQLLLVLGQSLQQLGLLLVDSKPFFHSPQISA